MPTTSSDRLMLWRETPSFINTSHFHLLTLLCIMLNSPMALILQISHSGKKGVPRAGVKYQTFYKLLHYICSA